MLAAQSRVVKYVDVRIRLPDNLLHPMAAFVRHENAVEYEELLAWEVHPGEGVEYELFYVEADPDRYAEAVSEVDSIVDYRVAAIDEESLHVWACEETRPEVGAWRGAFAGRHLVVVPPVQLGCDSPVSSGGSCHSFSATQSAQKRPFFADG